METPKAVNQHFTTFIKAMVELVTFEQIQTQGKTLYPNISGNTKL